MTKVIEQPPYRIIINPPGYNGVIIEHRAGDKSRTVAAKTIKEAQAKLEEKVDNGER